jgi:hypothetical protein
LSFDPESILTLEADLNSQSGQILTFLVYTVPVPAALSLFLVGLAGIAGASRRRILA